MIYVLIITIIYVHVAYEGNGNDLWNGTTTNTC